MYSRLLSSRIVYIGTGIYDTMQYVRAPVATMCVGQAAADAAVLLAAGEPGQRTVLPHARVVLTQPRTDLGRASGCQRTCS